MSCGTSKDADGFNTDVKDLRSSFENLANRLKTVEDENLALRAQVISLQAEVEISKNFRTRVEQVLNLAGADRRIPGAVHSDPDREARHAQMQLRILQLEHQVCDPQTDAQELTNNLNQVHGELVSELREIRDQYQLYLRLAADIQAKPEHARTAEEKKTLDEKYDYERRVDELCGMLGPAVEMFRIAMTTPNDPE